MVSAGRAFHEARPRVARGRTREIVVGRGSPPSAGRRPPCGGLEQDPVSSARPHDVPTPSHADRAEEHLERV